QSQVTFQATGGVTYFFEIDGPRVGPAGGALGFNGNGGPPPPHDDFFYANQIGSLPFRDTVDTTACTLETNEPIPVCAASPLAGSVWYAFTPAASGTVTASVQFGTAVIAAYTGTLLGSLTEVGCQAFGPPLTVRVNAGTTYYFQTGGLFGQRGSL